MNERCCFMDTGYRRVESLWRYDRYGNRYLLAVHLLRRIPRRIDCLADTLRVADDPDDG